MLTAFVMINVEPQKIADVAKQIANLPNISEVYSVTGEYDIIAVVRLQDYDMLAEAVPDGLSKVDGITRTNTVLAFRRFSASDLQAAWDLGIS
ncbi:MAG TPA: Lrp/AsnC ligand binding domain-containing protein [Roseiflexaceae bacterium]|nr:Lrp/AsnC ligand binding domain-containing protein [Roseiflexaceae bacterium]